MEKNVTRRFAGWMMLAAAALCGSAGAPLAGEGADSAQDREHRSAIEGWVASHRKEILDELIAFLSLPNSAIDIEAMRANADHLAGILKARGLRVSYLETGESGPYILAELDPEGAQAGAPVTTVLFYCHYDGQPVDASRWTVGSPFVPTLRGEPGDPEARLYGRSSADDKSPIVGLMAAVDALRAAGLPPSVRAKFIFDPEEEISSPHLAEVLREHAGVLAADLMIFADGPLHPSGRPTVVFGTRGIVTVTLEVYGPATHLHSGHYGNWAPNPAEKLASLLASMKDEEGRVLVEGFYDDVAPLSPADLEAIRAIPRADEELMERLLIAKPDGNGRSLAELIQSPSLNVRGLQAAGVGDEATTTIPASAVAEIDMRLVKGVSPEAQVARIKAHAAKQGFHVVEEEPSPEVRRLHPKVIRITHGPGVPASRTPIDTPLSQSVITAVRRAGEVEPVLMPTLGGTGPLSYFEEALGLPVYGVPVVNADNNQHGPDENLRLGDFWRAIVIYASLLRFPTPASADADLQMIAGEFEAGVSILAADGMEGRGLGTAGLARAADWIEAELRRSGLEPAFDGSYRQPFDVKVGVALEEGNLLEGVAQEDWTPLGFSSSGDFSGEIAFLGYGIESTELGYQELEGIDLKGKVALVLRYEPQERDDASPFDGKRPSRWSAMRYKTLQARERGAAAVVFVTGPLQGEEDDRLPVLKNDGPESPAGLPVIQVKCSAAQQWLSRAGVDLDVFQRSVDGDLTPRSVASTGVAVRGRVALETAWEKSWNLAGRIPGRGPLASEVVVVGAHYDHLGMGGEKSMRPNEEAIHNGADDNASGTVAALQIGARLRESLAAVASHRTIVIALFSGEEVGLAGSSRFVAEPPFPMERAAAMINLDMVGRLRDGALVALGSDSAPEWKPAIERALAQVAGLSVSSHGDGYGPSDQTSFYASGVPVLHLFTGAHDAYHTPDDDPATVNADGGARVVLFASALAADLAGEPVRLTYARSTSAPTMQGDSRGYGAYLGTVPDYTAMESTEGGVLLSDVRGGGPADLAGIRGKDRIVRMAGTRIENLYDMTYALQDSRPGETIEVVVVRGGEKISMKATLGDRAAMKSGAAPSTAANSTPGQAAASAATPPPVAAPPAVGAQPAASGVPAAAQNPHAAAPAAGDDRAPSRPKIDPFYESRPGPDFVPGAGSSFGRSFDGESHLSEIRQLTHGGENAEGYFSPDGRSLIFQSTPRGGGCDQEYILDLATGATRLVSTGKGRTTCGYFDWPEADRIIYSSTHGAGEACPSPPDRSQGYVWALYTGYDIYESSLDGSVVRPLTDHPGYDAEATWCHRGGRLVFTSDRGGDLDLWIMDEAGKVTRLTASPGYDGGAFFSPDCSEIVWRASRPEGEDLADYRRLLGQGLIRPGKLEIFVMKSDGTGARQITNNGAANFCPAFTAEGSRIIYASNAGAAGGREFDLWLIAKEGGEPERITTAPGFDGFPQFSPDGRWLVWASNRADPDSGETNLFLARWVEN